MTRTPNVRVAEFDDGELPAYRSSPTASQDADWTLDGDTIKRKPCSITASNTRNARDTQAAWKECKKVRRKTHDALVIQHHNRAKHRVISTKGKGDVGPE